jgi:tetratricopeptide (TPR) repeat protein
MYRRRAMRVRWMTIVACGFAAALACKRGNETKGGPSQPSATVATSASSSAASAAPSLPHLSATSASIALDNLDAQIRSAESHAWMRSALVELLLARGQYTGRIADYERAASITDAWVKEKKDDAAALLARASTESTFHRFADALADLDAAAKNGAKPEEVDPARASVFAATGRYDDAWALTPKGDVEPMLRTMQLAAKALLAGDMQSDAEATRLMTLAREKYVDVSPFPLAWMDAQEAKMLEREGKIADARAHYRRALDLLPQYATAAAHLAALSTPSDAIAMLDPLTKTSDDPEIEVQLADALRRAGRTDESATHLKAAMARYDDLLKAHPEAFSDHAAAMWLGPGRDPSKALPLAKANVANRPTPEAYDLYLAAALAARDDGEACAAAKGATALKYAPASLKDLAKTAMSRCPSTP